MLKKHSKAIPVNDFEQVAIPLVLLGELIFHVIGFVCALGVCARVPGDSLLVDDDFNDGAFRMFGLIFWLSRVG